MVFEKLGHIIKTAKACAAYGHVYTTCYLMQIALGCKLVVTYCLKSSYNQGNVFQLVLSEGSGLNRANGLMKKCASSLTILGQKLFSGMATLN